LIFNKKKYYFNSVSLTYEEIKKNRNFSILKFSLIALSFLGLAFISGYILNEEFGSKESRDLERQIESLSREMLRMYDRGTDYSNMLHLGIFTDDNNYRLILEIDTIPYPLRNAGRGGSASYNQLAKQADLTYKIGDLITTIDYQLRIQSHSFNTLYDKAIEYSAEKSHMPAIQPVSREDLIMIGSEFGIRIDPFIFIEKHHYGLDFVTAPGKKVYATGDGVVTFVQYSRTGYGNEIVIDHKFGYATRYGHLGSINLKEGELVKRGQFIGTVGATGRATGPHLHYEVLYKNQPVNPSYYFDTTLTSEEFAQIINIANGTTK
jgi:murein DD-endopeptidase MepM/ murein hydrolase activator NlpD